jgi:hypothetical protein
MFLVQKVNIFSRLQAKNKPREGETEHAFILGSMDCTVANTNFYFELWLTSIFHKKWHFKLTCTVLVVHNTVLKDGQPRNGPSLTLISFTGYSVG